MIIEYKPVWSGPVKMATTIAAALRVRFSYDFETVFAGADVSQAEVLVRLWGPADLLCYSDELHAMIQAYARYLAGQEAFPAPSTPIGRILHDALKKESK